MRAALVLILVLLMLPIAQGMEYTRIINTSEILANISKGLPVEYDHVIVIGDITLSDLKGLSTTNVYRTNGENAYGASEEVKIIISPIRITDSIIEGTVSFNNTVFGNTVSFVGSEFNSYANFVGSVFKSRVDFSYVDFYSDADFGYSKFNNHTDFIGSKFKSYSGFGRSRFNNDANFTQSEFNSYADFWGSEFNGTAYFTHSEFKDIASFILSHFNSIANFPSSKFNRANFMGSKFNGVANFRISRFNSASFSQSRFNDDADFIDSKFNSFADFSSSKFNSSTDFSRSQFNKFAKFDSVIFQRETIFSDSTFRGEASFKSSQFKEDALFEDAIFSGILNLKRTKYVNLFIRWDNIKRGIGYDDTAHQLLVENFKKLGFLKDADVCYYQFRVLQFQYQNPFDNPFTYIVDFGAWIFYGYSKKPEFAFFWSICTILFFSIIWRMGDPKKMEDKAKKGILEKYGPKESSVSDISSHERDWQIELHKLAKAISFSGKIFLSGTRLFIEPPEIPVMARWNKSQVEVLFTAERTLGAFFFILLFLAIGSTVVRS
jgi:hypothetical protein